MTTYDAVVVGARCAGTPLAALLARDGWSVLLVDRDPPPANTLSTHFLYPNTVARLEGLGVLDRIRAAGHRLNLVRHRFVGLGNETVGGFTPIDGQDRMCSITRPTLDTGLLETATDAGARTLFGERVTGLLGSGSADDPVTGVTLANGERIHARWVIGADGRASTVAKLLGLEKRNPLAGNIAFLHAYWRGLPETDFFHLDVREHANLIRCPCEDDLTILALGGPAELTRGGGEQRQARYLEGLAGFPGTFDAATLVQGEQVSPLHAAPETMMRGFYRDAAGLGWALIGDAGHFKHPGTAQGISDAIEQSVHVGEALTGADPELAGYARWRDERAAEHYKWSFSFGVMPKPEVAGPMFAGLAGDPQASQDFRDAFSRLKRPKSDVFTDERLGRWFAAAA
jgi:2-polyprenyl-6-methoxyphenol hydroxylase-like FAD-dependent oxidoreductase